MAEFPEHLDRGRHLDTAGTLELVGRRVFLALLTGLAVAALFSVVGQSPQRSVAAGGPAELVVSGPARVRGGLFFQGRFTIEARDRVEDAVLVLAPGWLESMHVNSIVPAPAEETGRDGDLALSYGALEPGDRLVVYMQFQVNPTNVGRRSADVALRDGDELLARVDRTITVLP